MKNPEPLLNLVLPSPGAPRVAWTGLHGSSTSLALAEVFARHPGPVCAIARSTAGVEQVERELEFYAGSAAAERFADYETLPYEPISPPQDLLADRLSCLDGLASGNTRRLVVSSDALLNRLPPPGFIVARSFQCRVGDTVDREALTSRLVAHGYLRVDQVSEPGEFAIRGALIDVFPAGAREPVRIDLLDDEVESLRLFDAESQISRDRVDTVRILPAREFPFDAEAIRAFRQRFRTEFAVDTSRCPLYRDISEAILPAGIEYYLPLFFDTTATLLDYLPADTLIVQIEDALDGLADGWALIRERHAQLEGDIERPILRPERGFVEPDAVRSALAGHMTLTLTGRDVDTPGVAVHDASTAHPLGTDPKPDPDRLNRWLAGDDQERTLVTASSAGRREMLLELLGSRGFAPRRVAGFAEFVSGDAALAVAVGELETGLRLPARGLRVVTGEQIGLERPRQRIRRRRPARDPDSVIRELTDLRTGAPVVHEEYGIGRYQGLVTMAVDEQPTEFLLLEYAGGDKLYVPVHDLQLVSRYTGAPADQAPLHRLGTDQWARAKRKAAQQARDVAAELLNLYALREARLGVELNAPADSYERFAQEFPFAETDDQLRAIGDVVADLAGTNPMDRIVCGDVGFGKTEVAMRASFVAVHAGFQVAILVPTTLLAQQHFRTFSDRFANWPVEIELLSRFRSAAESKRILGRLESGQVDIIVGTHKLLQRDTRFSNLGLVIVDEEHRFGVKHKEQLKTMRAEVDMLTLTATPIPRTLNMTLGGLRDLSIISTPPEERLSVRTFVGEWSERGIREAVLREIRRGGQIYFVHNRVENIEAIGAKLSKLIPEAELRIAHGQMTERALEDVMLDFYHRRFHILLCTTIIESGIDIANANTIIINRADKLGLAQLHQLRGRVGRSHHQAYAYMIAPPARALTPDAQKRLEAIASLEALGSGFTLATHDLEIRGAGELLGEGQSGQIQAIGFTLYNELLGRAVKALRDGTEPALEDPFRHGPEVDLGTPALIPEDYMPDVHMRLVNYKRIAGAATRAALDELRVELIDRFGLPPPPTESLFALSWLKLLAADLGLTRLRAGPAGGLLAFGDAARVDPAALVGLVADEPEIYRLDGAYKLRIRADWTAEARRIEAIEALLIRLGASRRDSEAA